MSQDLLYKIALTFVPNIGPVLSKNLIAYTGSAEAVFKENKKSLAKIPGIGDSKAKDIINADVFKRAEQEISFIDKNEIKCLFYLDDEYPKRMKNFDYCPIVLYYKGNQDLNHFRTVAIVGTRKPTECGKRITEILVENLKQHNVQIISGLAYGVDGIAHKKAVSFHLPNIAVLGNGLDTIYPAEHKELSKKIIKNGGLLTEFASGTIPDRNNFPMRNRIIAAMSDAVIVIESKISGGSIITAEYANEYNKDVFAVPGRYNDETSAGCNALIKRNKAHLIENIDDLLYIMRWEDIDKKRTVQTSLFIDLDPEEQRIVDILREKKEMSIDEMTYTLNIPTSVLAAQLLTLEFKGALRSLPGKMYILN